MPEKKGGVRRAALYGTARRGGKAPPRNPPGRHERQLVRHEERQMERGDSSERGALVYGRPGPRGRPGGDCFSGEGPRLPPGSLPPAAVHPFRGRIPAGRGQAGPPGQPEQSRPSGKLSGKRRFQLSRLPGGLDLPPGKPAGQRHQRADGRREGRPRSGSASAPASLRRFSAGIPGPDGRRSRPAGGRDRRPRRQDGRRLRKAGGPAGRKARAHPVPGGGNPGLPGARPPSAGNGPHASDPGASGSHRLPEEFPRRFALHSAFLSFLHPVSGRPVRLESIPSWAALS